MKDIQLPMGEDVARSLKLGEMITVSGLLFTGRSRFHIRAIEDNIYPPIDYSAINCFLHVGPVMRQEKDGSWSVVSCEPTSSIRFERYGADVVRKFNLHTLIGKTTMGPRTAAALKEVGGVYLSKIGLNGNAMCSAVKKVHNVYFLDELGKTECTWIYEVDHFGPFFVAMDSNGNNYFEKLYHDTAVKMPEIERKLNIPPDYAYTEVNG